MQRLALADRVELTPGDGLTVEGFPEDTLVRAALTSLALEAGVRPRWRARISKHIPVASGLGGGSSDAATALLLANATLDEPLPDDRLHELARALGADVPFFLASGPQLGQEEGGSADAARAPAGLLRPARAAARRREARDRPPCTTTSTAATAAKGTRHAAPRSSRRSPRSLASARPRRAAAERPRVVAARRRAACASARFAPT